MNYSMVLNEVLCQQQRHFLPDYFTFFFSFFLKMLLPETAGTNRSTITAGPNLLLHGYMSKAMLNASDCNDENI